LGEGGLEVFDNFRRDHIGIGKIRAVFERLVFEPEDVEVEFVALGQLFISETLEALGFFSFVAVFRIVVGDEVVEVAAL
jgi:hypothetical protein